MAFVVPVLGVFIAYISYLIYYRLYLSPIAQFPGPRLAALTYWYEFYYDIILRGKYIWKIRDLHEKYGPVVRINPGALHVNDPAFWNVLYTVSTTSNRRDKWDWETGGLGLDTSTLGTAAHALHKKRRTALNPFFSKQNVRKLEPRIEERVHALTKRLEATKEGEVIRLDHATAAFTNDVVMQFCFGRSDNHIEAPGFDPRFYNTSFNAAKAVALGKHIPIILTIVKSLPEHWAMKLGDEVSANLVMKNERIGQIDEIRSKDLEKVQEDSSTIFHTLLQSDLPESEKGSVRLAEEAMLLVGAGTHTTAWCITIAAFHLLANPALMRELRQELKAALPDPNSSLDLKELEKLPFLTGVLKEGLRLGYGTTVRSSRIAPDTALKCGPWTIPAGTPVSMTIPLTSHDESVFPNSHVFEPRRWIGEESAQLDRYLVSFSKGSRGCVGMNLAWAELYMCTAGIFRKFGSKEVRMDGDVGVLELFDTDEGDVRMQRDLFFPVAKDGSQGVRVRVVA